MPEEFNVFGRVLMTGHKLGVIAGIDILNVHVGHHRVIQAPNASLFSHDSSHVDVLQVYGLQFDTPLVEGTDRVTRHHIRRTSSERREQCLVERVRRNVPLVARVAVWPPFLGQFACQKVAWGHMGSHWLALEL